jgi:hypothetical protein
MKITDVRVGMMVRNVRRKGMTRARGRVTSFEAGRVRFGGKVEDVVDVACDYFGTQIKHVTWPAADTEPVNERAPTHPYEPWPEPAEDDDTCSAMRSGSLCRLRENEHRKPGTGKAKPPKNLANVRPGPVPETYGGYQVYDRRVVPAWRIAAKLLTCHQPTATAEPALRRRVSAAGRTYYVAVWGVRNADGLMIGAVEETARGLSWRGQFNLVALDTITPHISEKITITSDVSENSDDDGPLRDCGCPTDHGPH